MKKFLLLSIIMSNFIFAVAQKNSTFFVAYIYEQLSPLSLLPDSVQNKKVDVKVEYKKDSITSTENMESTIGKLLLSSFQIKLPIYIIANSDSSKTFFERQGDETKTESRVKITVYTPDTLFYKKGEWRQLNGSSDEIIIVNIEAIETKETKTILGYTCTKFLSSDSKKGEEITFWACKDLPNTLLPFTGLAKFKYGILEINHVKNQWHTKATEIKKL